MKRPNWSDPQLEHETHVDAGDRRYYNPKDMKAHGLGFLGRTANKLFGVRLDFYERPITDPDYDYEPIISGLESGVDDTAALSDPLLDVLENLSGSPSLEQEAALIGAEIAVRLSSGQPIDDLLDRSNHLGTELGDLRRMFDGDNPAQ